MVECTIIEIMNHHRKIDTALYIPKFGIITHLNIENDKKITPQEIKKETSNNCQNSFYDTNSKNYELIKNISLNKPNNEIYYANVIGKTNISDEKILNTAIAYETFIKYAHWKNNNITNKTKNELIKSNNELFKDLKYVN